MPKGSKCPITKIVVAKRNPNRFIYRERVELGRGYWLYLSRRGNFGSIAEFRISEDGVCKQNNLTNISEGRKDSQFLKYQRSRCGPEEQDDRFTQIVNFCLFKFDIKEKDFFELNEIPYENVPEETVSTYFSWGFYLRHYVPWQPKCAKEFDQLFLLESRINKLNKWVDFQLWIRNFSIFLFIILLVLDLISISHQLEYNEKKENREISIQKFRLVTVHMIYNPRILLPPKILAKSIVLIIFYISSNFASKIRTGLRNAVFKECSDEQTNKILEKILNYFTNSFYLYNIYTFLIIFAMLLCDVILLLFKPSSKFIDKKGKVIPLKVQKIIKEKIIVKTDQIQEITEEEFLDDMKWFKRGGRIKLLEEN